MGSGDRRGSQRFVGSGIRVIVRSLVRWSRSDVFCDVKPTLHFDAYFLGNRRRNVKSALHRDILKKEIPCFLDGFMQKVFVSFLRMLRLTSGLSQDALSKDLGISRQTLSSLESAKSQPTLLLAYKISEYFHRPIERIFFFKDL